MNKDYRFRKPVYLTHPNIPKPLHGVNPRTILGESWWDIKRHEAYAENNFCCWACGVHKSEAMYENWLEGHEAYDINWETGEVRLEEIVALCHCCHNFVHNGRLEVLHQWGKVDRKKYSYILSRGKRILKNAGLKKEVPPEKIAGWSEWRLIIKGNEYYSKFKNIEEWAEYYPRNNIGEKNAKSTGKNI